jgi:hypothetical protein
VGFIWRNLSNVVCDILDSLSGWNVFDKDTSTTDNTPPGTEKVRLGAIFGVEKNMKVGMPAKFIFGDLDNISAARDMGPPKCAGS